MIISSVLEPLGILNTCCGIKFLYRLMMNMTTPNRDYYPQICGRNSYNIGRERQSCRKDADSYSELTKSIYGIQSIKERREKGRGWREQVTGPLRDGNETRMKAISSERIEAGRARRRCGAATTTATATAKE